MKFTPGPLAADLSGSIGSTTASRNRFGPYFRTKAIPVNPNTTRQQTVRTLFATMVNLWNNLLTQVQRDSWELWADNTTILGKDGSPINITGQNAYIRFNVIREQIGLSRNNNAPIVFNNGSPITGFKATQDSAPGVIELAFGGLAMATDVDLAGPASDDGDVAVYLGGPVNAARTFFKGPYQLASVIPIAAAASTVDWDTLLTAMTQAIAVAVGQFRSVRFRVVYDDGRLSEKFEALANVTIATV